MIKKLISKSKQMLSFICVIAVGYSCFFSANTVNANDVDNSYYLNDFETTYSAGEFTSGGNISNDKSVGYNSSSSAKIVSTGYWPVFTPAFKTQVNKKYRFSFWYKVDTENTDTSKSLAVIRLGSSYKKWLNIKNTKEKNATWTQFTYEFTATKTDCEINIQFYPTSNAGGAYTAYIDGVSVLPSCEMSILSGAENGTGEVNATSVFYGTSVTFKATPEEGYTLEKWVDVNGTTVSTDNPYVVSSVTSDMALKPVFKQEKPAESMYSNDFETTYSTGEFTGGGSISNDKSVGYNSSSSAKIVSTGYWPIYTPNYKTEIGRKYSFSFWYKVDTQVTDTSKSVAMVRLGTSAKKWLNFKNTAEKNGTWTKFTYEFTATKTDCEVNIQFYPTSNAGGAYTAYIDGIAVLPSFNMSILSGAVNGIGEVSADIVFYGQTATFKAIPKEGYTLEKWIDVNGATVSTEETYVVSNVTSNLALKPVFKQEKPAEGIYSNDFESTYSAGEFTGGGNISNDKTVGYNSSSSAKIVSTGSWPVYSPNYKTEIGRKYHFSFWYKVDTQVTDTSKSFAYIIMGAEKRKYLNLKDTAEKNGTWTKVTGEFTATKTDNDVNICFYPTTNAGGAYTAYIDDVTVLPSFSMSVLTGAVNGMGEVNAAIAFYGTSATFTATPDKGYTLEKWVDKKGETVSTENPYVVASVTSDLALKPVFCIDSKQPLTDKYDFESSLRVQDYYIKSDDATVSTSDHHGGNSALNLKTGNDYFSPNFILKAGEPYSVSFYYKTTASNYVSAYVIPLNHGSITQWGKAKVESYLYSTYSASRNLSTGSTAWKKYQFETIPTEDSRIVICGIDGYLDDFSIGESLGVPEEQLLTLRIAPEQSIISSAIIQIKNIRTIIPAFRLNLTVRQRVNGVIRQFRQTTFTPHLH